MIFFTLFCFLALLPHTIKAAEKITILTYPVEQYSNSRWSHPAVTGSLVRGLEELKINYNFNPSRICDVGSTVVVLTNIDALKQAIDWKRKGKIKKLLAGPNLMVRADDYERILSSPEIDVYLVPSVWTKVAYIEDEPSLENRIGIWPAGINIDEWEPQQKSKNSKHVLIYWKTESEDFCKQVEQLLKNYGWQPKVIKYGQYALATYKELLSVTAFAVFISRSESQGLALAEAWAMNVPTLVWNPQELTINGRIYSESSACPYLTTQTGNDWKTIEELEALLKTISTTLVNFSPRTWMIHNMSDAVSCKILIALIDSIKIN